MSDRPSHSKVQKVMVAPINLIFRLLQSQVRASVWLANSTDCRYEGKIVGFDEFMNLVLDDTVEVHTKGEQKKTNLGRILLKGDSVGLIRSLEG